MAGYAKMRFAFKSPNEALLIYTHMPTEREHSHHNPEIKHDNRPSSRLKFLDYAESYMYNFCITCFIMRTVVIALAIYGLYKLFN